VKDSGMREISRGPKAVQAGQGRTIPVLGERVILKTTAEDTGGGLAMVEMVTPPQAGPPLHVHHREDEGLYVLEGMYEIRAGGRMIPAPPGTCVFLPRDVPHTYTNVGYRTGKLLVTITPAGFERFFEELGQLAPAAQSDRERLAVIGQKYGLEII
jgi:mannose-6-phosphate isomerase-like protein (cupin superfamily)